ncbi:MAG: YIP1 family protein [Saccharofermentanales bacterium]
MNLIEMSVLILFHPTDAFDEIKIRDRKLSYLPGIVILMMVLAMRYLYVLMVHAPLADIRIQDTSIVLEIARILLPIITLVCSIYAVESIMSGETSFRMIFLAVSYSFVPYLLITPLMTLVSHILSREDASLYHTINNGMWVWIAILIFSSIFYMNNFTFGKSLKIAALGIAGILMIWGVAVMILALSIQLIEFFGELYKEYILYNL